MPWFSGTWAGLVAGSLSAKLVHWRASWVLTDRFLSTFLPDIATGPSSLRQHPEHPVKASPTFCPSAAGLTEVTLALSLMAKTRQEPTVLF